MAIDRLIEPVDCCHCWICIYFSLVRVLLVVNCHISHECSPTTASTAVIESSIGRRCITCNSCAFAIPHSSLSWRRAADDRSSDERPEESSELPETVGGAGAIRASSRATWCSSSCTVASDTDAADDGGGGDGADAGGAGLTRLSYNSLYSR